MNWLVGTFWEYDLDWNTFQAEPETKLNDVTIIIRKYYGSSTIVKFDGTLKDVLFT